MPSHVAGFSSYALIPAAWLLCAAVWLWVSDPAHKRTRRALAAILHPLILPVLGLALWLRIID